MISLTSHGTELRRFRHGTLPKIAVGAMLLIPLLYGALYLWAFWDPTGNLNKLPVALVNADQPAPASGKNLPCSVTGLQDLHLSCNIPAAGSYELELYSNTHSYGVFESIGQIKVVAQ